MRTKVILVVSPIEELFQRTAVAAGEGRGPWPAMRCQACGWIAVVDAVDKVPPHECSAFYESESETSTKRKPDGWQRLVKDQLEAYRRGQK